MSWTSPLKVSSLYRCSCGQRPGGIFFGWSNRVFFTTRRVFLEGDWNTVLDPYLDRSGVRSATYNPEVKSFRDFIDRFDLVDNFRNEHPEEAM